jgi:hypothetical protein
MWEKKGLIIQPPVEYYWLAGGVGHCHAAFLSNRKILLTLCGRDELGRSRIGEALWSIDSGECEISGDSLIPLGELGTFDYNGTSYPWVVCDNNTHYLYYTGWNQGLHVPFMNGLGLAIKNKSGNYIKQSRAPIIHRSDAEPIGTGSVCVLKEHDLWRMWYTSFERWGSIELNEERHYYNIKYAESDNGVDWKRLGKICINFNQLNGEYVTGKPAVIKYKGWYLMWFSCRGESYRIGFAASRDGFNWLRNDAALGLEVSSKGWDSEMVCYGFPLLLDKRIILIYCGNRFGRTGLGWAQLSLNDLDFIIDNFQ